MSSKGEKKQKSSGGFGSLKWLVIAGLAVLVRRNFDAVLTNVTFLLSAHFGFKYVQNDWYWSRVKQRLQSMPIVEPTPIPEMDIADFSREKLLKLSNNMADPVVIRGAVKDSAAVQKWSREYFQSNYGNETIVVREVVDGVVRFQHRNFNDFYLMQSKGRNVSIVASSSIFYRNPKFKQELRSSVEDSLVGPNGEPIIAQQFFITPSGRSWYHCAVGNNVFRQIAGQKRWVLIDPKRYNQLMCPAPVITGTSVTPCLEELPFDEAEEWIRHIPRITALLNPGDILINGPWWWHDVQSIGDTSAPQISVAGRIKNIKETFGNAPVLTANAIITRIIGGESNGEVDFELDLEDNIVRSWTANCLSKGRTDCVTDP